MKSFSMHKYCTYLVDSYSYLSPFEGAGHPDRTAWDVIHNIKVFLTSMAMVNTVSWKLVSIVINLLPLSLMHSKTKLECFSLATQHNLV
jgi:hypothetical protein